MYKFSFSLGSFHKFQVVNMWFLEKNTFEKKIFENFEVLNASTLVKYVSKYILPSIILRTVSKIYIQEQKTRE